LRQGRRESIDKALGEGVESHRHESVCVFRHSGGDAASEVRGGVTFERDCQDPMRRPTDACLQQVGSPLCEEFGLARSRSCHDGRVSIVP
jgi:hypothetical protein